MVGILVFGLAVLLRERGSLVSILFFLMTLLVSVWLFGYSLMYSSLSPDVALWWTKFAWLGVCLIPPAIYHFGVVFLRIYPKNRTAVWTIWTVFLGFLILHFKTDALIGQIRRFWWGYYPQHGWLSFLFLPLFFSVFIASLAHYILEGKKTPPGCRKSRIKLFLRAFVIGYFGTFDFLPYEGITLYPFGYLPILGFIAIAATAIWRYRLVDLTPAFAANQILDTMQGSVIVIDLEGVIRVVNRAACIMLKYNPSELLGTPLSSITTLPLPAGERFSSGWDKGVYDQVMSWKTREGQEIPVSVSVSEIADSHHPVGKVYVGIDITERKQAEDALHLLVEVTAAASESNDIQEMTSVCLEKICKLKKWQVGQVWFFEEKGNKLVCSSQTVYQEKEIAGFRDKSLETPLNKGEELPGRVWETNKAVWITDVSRDKNFYRADEASQAGLKTGFAFPIIVEQELYAVFEFFSPKIRTPDAYFLNAIQRMGVHLGNVYARRLARDQLTYVSTHDPLTDLPNRDLFSDRLKQALCRASRRKRLVGILLCDLDNFKNINDTLGHQIGDLFLQTVSKRLGSAIRDGDTISRLGGDEFAIILDDVASAKDIPRVARKILDSLTQSFHIEGNELFITASIGISVCPGDGKSANELLKNAEAALYKAKQGGRNNFQLYSAEMNEVAFDRLTLETRLRHAMERSEFLLYYQPVVNLNSGQITGAEALIRWQHPEKGLVFPGEFITVMAEMGLIVPIGIWSMREACAQNKAWQDAGLPPIQLAVNVSARQFQQKRELMKIITRILKETGLEARHLELELTEGAIIQDAEAAISCLKELHEMGVEISIDDFGTGYSSLSYLQRFSINTLKIDRSFVNGISVNKNGEMIVSTIITLAHNLNMKVVAEGVETEAQLQFLRAHHCDEIQGFLFSPAVSPEAFRGLLLQKKWNLLKPVPLKRKKYQKRAA